MSKPKIERNIAILDNLLKDLLTPSEIKMLQNRYEISKLLQSGLSIRAVAAKAQVGTDTVMRVARMVEKKGLQKVGLGSKIKTKTPWIFGRSDD